MFLRDASTADLPSILLIEHSCFPLGVAFGPAQVRRLLRNPRAYCRVAQGAGARGTSSDIAGWAVGLIRRHRHSKSARLYTLAIDPDCQGQGVGRLLVEDQLAHFRAEGASRVYLEVRSDNTRAIGLYEKLGFKIVRKLPKYYEDGRDGVRMMR